MMRFLLLLALFPAAFASAQSAYKVYFTPKVDNQHFGLGDLLTDDNGKKMTIDHFNYYISHLHVIHDGGQDLDLSDTVFLIKHNNFSFDLGELNITQLEKIKFGVGVPYELSHLDISQYPENHPLSYQSPSMQWGWAAGYMHMIVGGMADSDNDELPDAYFELHNLGDGNYYEIELDVTATNEAGGKSIYIDCNLDTWLGTTDLGTNGVKHNSTGVNYTVMKNVILRPVFTSSVNAAIQENALQTGEAFFFRNTSGNFLKWSGMQDLQGLRLLDLNGKLLLEQELKLSSGETELGTLKSGAYFVQFYGRNNMLLHAIKIAL